MQMRNFICYPLHGGSTASAAYSGMQAGVCCAHNLHICIHRIQTTIHQVLLSKILTIDEQAPISSNAAGVRGAAPWPHQQLSMPRRRSRTEEPLALPTHPPPCLQPRCHLYAKPRDPSAGVQADKRSRPRQPRPRSDCTSRGLPRASSHIDAREAGERSRRRVASQGSVLARAAVPGRLGGAVRRGAPHVLGRLWSGARAAASRAGRRAHAGCGCAGADAAPCVPAARGGARGGTQGAAPAAAEGRPPAAAAGAEPRGERRCAAGRMGPAAPEAATEGRCGRLPESAGSQHGQVVCSRSVCSTLRTAPPWCAAKSPCCS